MDKLVSYLVLCAVVLVLCALNVSATRRFASYMQAVEHVADTLDKIEQNTRK